MELLVSRTILPRIDPTDGVVGVDEVPVVEMTFWPSVEVLSCGITLVRGATELGETVP
jgi:hypothetical protein